MCGLGASCQGVARVRGQGRGFQEGVVPGWSGRPAGLAGGSPDASPATVDDYLLPIHLELPSFAPPAQLVPTIYPSEEGVTKWGASGRKGQAQDPHMLSAAVRIHLDPQKNVKVQPHLLLPAHWPGRLPAWCMEGWVPCLLTVSYPQEFLVTLRLYRATLRHYITLPEQSWHSQVSEAGTGRPVSRLGGGGAMGLGWVGG